MQLSVLSGMLFDLIENGKATSAQLSEKYGLSPRSVARYIARLRTRLPILVKRGRNGGIYLSECYKLPANWLSQEEYETTIDALALAYSLRGDHRYAQARHKLLSHEETAISAATLSGETSEIICDCGLLNANNALTQTLTLIKTAISEKGVLEIVYEQSARGPTDKIEPYQLIFRCGVWYLYAFCYTRRRFHLFTIGRVIAIRKTDERFQKRPFSQAEIDGCFLLPAPEYIQVRLLLADGAVDRVRDRIGVGSLQRLHGKWYAHLTVENTDESMWQILSLGTGVQVLSPVFLREKIAKIGKALSTTHEE